MFNYLFIYSDYTFSLFLESFIETRRKERHYELTSESEREGTSNKKQKICHKSYDHLFDESKDIENDDEYVNCSENEIEGTTKTNDCVETSVLKITEDEQNTKRNEDEQYENVIREVDQNKNRNILMKLEMTQQAHSKILHDIEMLEKIAISQQTTNSMIQNILLVTKGKQKTIKKDDAFSYPALPFTTVEEVKKFNDNLLADYYRDQMVNRSIIM